MAKLAAKYLHRKCRRPACGKWSLFRSSDRRTAECSFCGAPYGRLEVGMDVQSPSAAEPVITGRDARQATLAKLPDVKPGDFEYVPPRKGA